MGRNSGILESKRVNEGKIKILKQICYHPEIRPMDWNQPKPKPAEMIFTCECGQNASCPVCGWGQGTYPCECYRERLAKRVLDSK